MTRTNMDDAEALLLRGIRAGDADAWARLVNTYQGRLLAFARARGLQASAEDVVQETFLSFLRGLSAYRGDAGIETYLFLLLRRRIADHFRNHRKSGRRADSDDALDALHATGPSPSLHMRQAEADDASMLALADALGDVVLQMQEDRRLDDLLALDLLLTAALPNRDIAAATGLDAARVATLKSRTLARLARTLSQINLDVPTDDSALRHVWRTHRLGCPKRTTLGGQLLGSLDPAWSRYVTVHLNEVACAYCAASLLDLEQQTDAADRAAIASRILNSTRGFF